MSATTSVRCCIAGGGPAGMMLGALLARAGVSVLVLEKHADFLRDFRGDTLHPSTLEVMHELGWLQDLLRLPHQEVRELRGQIGEVSLAIADFSHLSTRCGFVALMPQWDFLNFIAERARAYPTFRLLMRAEAKGLLEESGRIVGARVTTADGPLEVRADLVVGADGRHSTVRERSRLQVRDLGAPMDVMWFRLSRQVTDPGQIVGRIDAGRIFVQINRGEHWQCGYVIAKGAAESVKARGLEAFGADIARLTPWLADRTAELRDWDDVKLLTVAVDRLERWWRPGLLCIGDAAHAMSPVGGVGINLAIQDAVAAANVLAAPLREARLEDAHLAAVQARRELPTRVTQTIQIAIQRRVIRRVLGAERPITPPLVVRWLGRSALLRRLPGWLIGIGIRPEHVRTPAAAPPAATPARG